MEILTILLMFLPVLLIFIIVFHVQRQRKKKEEAAAWVMRQYTDPDMVRELINESGIIFGQKNGATIARTEEMRGKEGHILVVGGSGSGKSSCIAIPTLLTWNQRVFAIDIKGELYEKTKHARPNIKVFNPQDKNAFGYDPYIFLKKSQNPAQEARAIAQALIPLPPNIDNPFWIETAQNILTGAILHYYESHSFIETLKAIQSQSPVDLIKTISESHSDKARMHVMNFAGNSMNDTLSGIFAELSRVVVTLVADDDIISALSRKKVIAPTDLEYGHDIYINIPEHLLDQWKNLLGLMINQFLTFFERRDEAAATPILFLLDEFARLGKIEKIKNGLSTLRGKKVVICLIIQSLAQIDSIYGETDRKVICDNCNYKAILNATDKDSQEYFSKIVGTWDKPKITQSTGQTNSFLSPGSKSDGVSQTTEKTDIIKPEEFATLKDIILLTPFPTSFTPSGFFRVNKQPYYLPKQQPVAKDERSWIAKIFGSGHEQMEHKQQIPPTQEKYADVSNDIVASHIVAGDKQPQQSISNIPFICGCISSAMTAIVAISFLILGAVWGDFEVVAFAALVFAVSALCYIAGFISKSKPKISFTLFVILVLGSIAAFITYILIILY